MGDFIRVSNSASPQVDMSDVDADNVMAIHHDVGQTVGSTINIDVIKWSIDMAKDITSTTGEKLIGVELAWDYSFLFLKNTGVDSNGDSQDRSVSLSLDTGTTYSIKLNAGMSVNIPIAVIAQNDIMVKCTSASGIVCEYIGAYTT